MQCFHGDIIRMTSFTHVEPDSRTRIKFDDRKKVTVFMLLGEENKDGTEPLDLEKRLNELGWFKRDSETHPTPNPQYMNGPCPDCGASNLDEAAKLCSPSSDETGDRFCPGRFNERGMSESETPESLSSLDEWCDHQMREGMKDALTVPRDILQRAHDTLEEIPDWADAGSETWILYHQLSFILQEVKS